MATDPMSTTQTSGPVVEPPLVVICGPTASGKTALAVKVAQQCRGEIICADSRTVYRGMDIGTAKPTISEQQGVPHWGLDLVEPGERFTAAQFQRYAQDAVQVIRARGGVPIIAGGTGLYIDAVIYDYEFGVQADERRRRILETMSLEELHNHCYKNNVQLPENIKNKRYVIRAIEQHGVNRKRKASIIDNTLVVGISTETTILRTRIASRIEQMLQHDVVEEAIILGKKYGWDSQAMTGNIYPLVREYTEGRLSLLEFQQKAATLDWRLAKRQLTWFRRNQDIRWLSYNEAEHYLGDVLAPWMSS